MSIQPTKMRRRATRLLFIILSVAGLAAGTGIYTHYYGVPRRFSVVKKGVLYRSGQPYEAQINHLVKQYGLRTIIMARKGISANLPDEIERAESMGVHVIHLPILSRRPISKDQIDTFFRYVDDPANHPVLVHCSAGLHRTGFLCGLFRIERQGWTVERAVEEMLSYEPDMDPHRPELRQLKQYKPGSLAKQVQGISSRIHSGVITSP